MRKKDLKVGGVYNLKFYKTHTVPVRIVKLANYKAVIEYVEKETLKVLPVPNPRTYGAVTEAVPYNLILSECV